jgi:hypothetical protein
MAESRPEPVVDAGKVAGAIAGVVTAIFSVLVVVGVVKQEDADTWLFVLSTFGGAVATLVAAALPIYQAYQARKKVTPLSDPENEEGVALVPAA